LIKNLLNSLVILIVSFQFLFSTYAYSTNYRQPSFIPLPSHRVVPDFGNLSDIDNISDLTKPKFSTNDDNKSHQFYLYALAQRLLAIKNILAVTRITRSIGNLLGLDRNFLTSLPSSIKNNFIEQKFPDLYSLIDPIQQGNFPEGPRKLDSMARTLFERSIKIFELNVQMKITENRGVEDIKKKYPKKLIWIPTYLNSGFIPIPRLFETKEYSENIAALSGNIANFQKQIDQLTNELFLYLPFYTDGLLKNLYNSLFEERKPSFFLSDLIAASIFFNYRPQGKFETREKLAKWIHSGIDNIDETNKLENFFKSTQALRDEFAHSTDIPAAILNELLSAFAKGIRQSIEIQNASLDFLASASFVVRDEDSRRNCHYKAREGKTWLLSRFLLKYTKLPGELAFLSQFKGLREQFENNYVSQNHFPIDLAKVFHHQFATLYENELEGNENRWVSPLRWAYLCAAFIIPGFWIAIAVIVGTELIISSVKREDSSIFERETNVLMSLFDSEGISSERDPSDTRGIDYYKGWLARNDQYKGEVFRSYASIPLIVAIYASGYALFRGALSSAALKNVIKTKSFEPLKNIFKVTSPSLKLGHIVVGSIVGLGIVGLEIKDALAPTQQELKFATNTTTDSLFVNVEMFRQKVTQRKSELINYFNNSSLDSLDNNLELTKFLRLQDSSITLYDVGSTRVTQQSDGNPQFLVNYEYFSDDSVTKENLIFEIAYYWYLHRASDLIQEKASQDDPNFASLLGAITNSSKYLDKAQSIDETSQNDTSHIAEAYSEGIFELAEQYAKRLGGVRDPNRNYFGIGALNE
jgi:hypothetical protein